MGWNRLEFLHPENPLFEGLEAGHVYFVHSYHARTEVESDLLAVTDYGHPVTAIVGRETTSACSFTRRRAVNWA